MTRWDQLQTLFHEALALPAQDRDAYLDVACADDSALKTEVLALLAAESDADATIAPNLSDAGRLLLESLDENLIGSQVGAYRLLRLIGTGGMGSVFLGERADGAFERQVAVKIVKKGMDSAAVLQRFERERQILARLSHPNIAGLLDGGLTDDGRPYFVLEYVAGEPIVTYCDARQLMVPKRLALFQTVCRAVHYAHQNLVVHRDLKPSNILVTEHGTVKLLDFGIAKTLDSSEDVLLTQTSAAPFTPAYAAPEQLLGEPVSTSTDVYALGVVLYELLAGQRPFEAIKSHAQLRDEVLSGDPPRPSAALTRSLAEPGVQASMATMSRARRLDVEGLRQRLRGDLDVICLTALRREPEQRYGSAEAFATDLALHLLQQPVSARPPTFGYRAAKFIRRNRLPLAAAAGVLVTVIAMVTYYTDELAEQRDFAVAEQAKTQRVVEFVIGLFERADPSQARGVDVTARELLEAGSRQIDTELTAQPVVRAKLKQVLGSVYYSLGSETRALTLLSAALEEQLANSADALDASETQLLLGSALQSQGDYPAAGTLFSASLETRERLFPTESAEVGEVIRAQAFLAQTEGQFEHAERLFADALTAARQRAAGSDDAYLAKAMNQLADLYRLMDRPREAEPLLTESLAMQNRVYGGPHPESSDTKRMLAGLYRDTARFEESKALYEEVLAERTSMLGEDHREVIHTWNSYSQLFDAMGDHQGMLDANQKMIVALERVSKGKPHTSLPGAYHNRAYAMKQLGRQHEAIVLFQKSIAAQDAVGMASDHPNRAYPMASMGQSYRLVGDHQRALELGQQALELRLAHYPEDHRLISEVKSDLGYAHMELEQFDLAEPYFLESYAGFRGRHGEGHVQTKTARNNLRTLYERAGQADKAAAYAPL